MAKMAATETAQRVIDRAVQMFGGRGVKGGELSRDSTARSAPFGSMKAQPRCKS
jgi:alkylation response protein AidB-like acyl-CoA dehydrogenase